MTHLAAIASQLPKLQFTTLGAFVCVVQAQIEPLAKIYDANVSQCDNREDPLRLVLISAEDTRIFIVEKDPWGWG